MSSSQDTQNIKPYDPSKPKAEQVEQMFDSIAPAYDFMNRAMTLGIDKTWRRTAINHIPTLPDEPRILDIATGTADLAIALARRYPQAQITGVDLSAEMIKIGQQKVRHLCLDRQITLHTADCLHLPYPDSTFDCITIAYGIRNLADISAGYREIHRVLRPGGQLCVIELSLPSNPIVCPFYKIYTRAIIPTIGRLVSKDHRAYTYLPETIAAVPARQEMCQIIADAGFPRATYHALTLGVCCVYYAQK